MRSATEWITSKQEFYVTLCFLFLDWTAYYRLIGPLGQNYVRDRHLLLFLDWLQRTCILKLSKTRGRSELLDGCDFFFVCGRGLFLQLICPIQSVFPVLSNDGSVNCFFASDGNELLRLLNQNFFLVVVVIVQIRVKWDAFHFLNSSKIGYMFVICWSAHDGETISFKQHLQCIWFYSLWIILEKFKQILRTEVFVKVTLTATTVVYCCQTHALFVDLTPVNFFFYSTHCKQSVNDNISLLTYSKHSINSLIVICWIPVWVEYDCTVCPCQV